MNLEARLDEDSRDLIALFATHGVEFLVVGAHALAVNGFPRATQDLDLWVKPSPANAERVIAALKAFGAPLNQHGVTQADFDHPGTTYQIGLPPRRIDIISDISGVTFDEAWPEHVTAPLGGRTIPFLGRAALIKNKKATGRLKDLADVEVLEGGKPKK